MNISIVTPSYKQLRWLKLCVASVADQQGVAFEHLIQDAQTGPELEEWVAAHSNAKLFVEKDSGMYDAINRGFLKTTGDIVAWLNCDEQYLPGALAKVAAFFDQHPEIDVLFGDAVLLSDQGTLLSYRRAILPSLAHIQLSHLNTLSCATFVRRSVIERGLLLKPEWKAIADAVWVADMIKAKLRMAVLPEPLAAFTMTEENLGQSSLAFKEGERWQMQTTTPWLRSMRGPIILLHRVRKFWHGAYAVRTFSTEVYTHASPHARVPVASQRLSFIWTRSGEEGIQERAFGGIFEALTKAFQSNANSKIASSKSLPFSFYQPARWPFFLSWLVLPVLFTLAILVLEQETSTAITVTPMLSMILMLLLAFRLGPWQLIPFVIAFTGAIYVSIHYMQPFDALSLVDWVRMGLRVGSFLVASALAVLFSKSRCEAKARQDQTVAILTTLPMPVVISDALGSVIFANDEAVEFLKIPRGKLLGASYSRLLMTQQDEGTAMRDYIKFFRNTPEALLARDRGFRLAINDGTPHDVEARFICLGQGEARYMVTVLRV